MAIHSNILAWRIPWTEEPAGLLTESQTQLSDQHTQLPNKGKVKLHFCPGQPEACSPPHKGEEVPLSTPGWCPVLFLPSHIPTLTFYDLPAETEWWAGNRGHTLQALWLAWRPWLVSVSTSPTPTSTSSWPL